MKLIKSLIVALVIVSVFTQVLTKETMKPELQHSEFGTFVTGHAVDWERVKNWVYPWRWFQSSPTANPPPANNTSSTQTAQPAAAAKPAKL